MAHPFPSGTGRMPVLKPKTRGNGPLKIVTIGIDLGQNLCSLAGLDEAGAIVLRQWMKLGSV